MMNYLISSININNPLGKGMDPLQSSGALFLSRQKSSLLSIDLVGCRVNWSRVNASSRIKTNAINFFAYDHQNYARYMSFHLGEISKLPKAYPEMYKEFMHVNIMFIPKAIITCL